MELSAHMPMVDPALVTSTMAAQTQGAATMLVMKQAMDSQQSQAQQLLASGTNPVVNGHIDVRV